MQVNKKYTLGLAAVAVVFAAASCDFTHREHAADESPYNERDEATLRSLRALDEFAARVQEFRAEEDKAETLCNTPPVLPEAYVRKPDSELTLTEREFNMLMRIPDRNASTAPCVR